MKKFVIFIFALILICGGGISVWLLLPQNNSMVISRIGIGGGGAFLNAVIDPTNQNILYSTSDMGGLYYSHNQGASWNRTEARAVFTQMHISETGVLFAGGNGIYSSRNQGKSLELIYPQDVKYSVSRCGWNENLMLAAGYNNGYVKCITSNAENVFFATIDWEGELLILKCDYDGKNLQVLHTQQTAIIDPMSDIDMFMACNSSGLYVTVATKIYFYNFSSKNLTQVYSTSGYIKDIEIIGSDVFFIDDLQNESLILYTTDFGSFSNLLDFNTLPNKFTKYGRNGTFGWHFKGISGNNFNNIYLSFSSAVNEYADTVDGIMKFNGTAFEWIFDSMFKTRFVTEFSGWSYGSHGPFFAVNASPHNDNICIVANIETIYVMEYPNEENKKIKTLHCKDYGNGKFSTTGLDVQTTYFVKEDPFDKNHIIICTTDLGLQNSFDNGKTWQRMEITQEDYEIYNTCYDLHFDKFNKNKLYGIWSSRHDAPYNPTIYDKDTTKGAFALSSDGGLTWDFGYSNGLPADCIPIKMSINQTKDNFIIAISTFNRGFYLSNDGGKNFVSINNNMATVNDLIYGEDVVLTENKIYCLTAPYLQNNSWQPSKLYEYNIQNSALNNIDLGEIVLARSLSYSEEKGLFINVLPTFKYKWFEEYNSGLWENLNGGIYNYKDGIIKKIFENNDGIFYSAFAPNGKMYATDTYGKVFQIDETGGTLLLGGLFNMLKNISFSSDGKILYITTFGGGTYKVKLQ